MKELAYSVIPVGKDKRPLLKWEYYQKERATEEKIMEWWAKWPEANVGIVTGVVSDLAVVDIDTQEGEEAIQNLIPDSLVMPTCTTPKGGKHLYFRCPDAELGNNARLVPGCDLRANGGYVVAPPSVSDTGKRYSWLPGLDPLSIALPVLPESYLLHIKNNISFIPYRRDISLENTARARGSLYRGEKGLFEQGRRDEDLFHVANCLIKGGMPENDVFQVVEFLAKKCNPPFSSVEAATKVQSALQRQDGRERSISNEIRAWLDVTSGFFTVTDVYRELHLLQKAEKGAARVALHRLFKEGLIQKHPSKSSTYKLNVTTVTKMDMKRADMESLDLTWPLGLEELVTILPGNLAVIAGTSNAGKTAFLMNFMRLNMDRYKFHYFNTEMGETEIKGRLCASDVAWEEWQRLMAEGQVNFYSDPSDFAGRIFPDDINIVDFLEIGTDFYRVGEFISEIYQVTRERKGMCFIALQKKTGAETGRGGEFSLEKPRLYLSMDYDRIKIIKAKNWQDRKVNPNKMMMRFKIGPGGWGFQPMEPEWEKEEGARRG